MRIRITPQQAHMYVEGVLYAEDACLPGALPHTEIIQHGLQ